MKTEKAREFIAKMRRIYEPIDLRVAIPVEWEYILNACRIIGYEEEEIFKLRNAIQKAIPLIYHDNGIVGPSEMQAIKILEKPLMELQKKELEKIKNNREVDQK